MLITPSISHTHSFFLFFFFNDTATTEIYTLSLHDALPISQHGELFHRCRTAHVERGHEYLAPRLLDVRRSEEHTSELQSQSNLVCRLLLEKKKKKIRHKCTPSCITTITSDSRTVIIIICYL